MTPLQGLRESRAVSTFGRPAVWIIVTALVAFAPSLGLSPANSRQLVLIMLLALVVSGLNLSFGFAGELSFAQPTMYAVGAYVTATLTMHWTNEILLSIALSCLAGMVVGLVAGIPSIRLGGWMLAITSLYLVLLVPDVVTWTKEWTGGLSGLSGIPIAELFGHQLTDEEFLMVIAVATSIWFALMRNLVVSRAGNTLSVLRQSPLLAQSLGISVVRTKLKVFALSGLPAAMAGTFFAYLDGFVAPEAFGLHLAIIVIATSILGGSRSVYGVFIGAALMQLGPLQSSAFGEYAFIAYGLFLILAGVALQRGIAGFLQDAASKVRARLRPSAAIDRGQIDAVELPPLRGQALEIADVSKAFGGNQVLTDVGFTVQPGEVVALIGPNGSGKTTLLNIVSGYYARDTGTVRIGEEVVSGKPPHVVARAGIARTFQTPAIPDMSVRDVVESSRTHVRRVSIIETMLRLPRYRAVAREDRRTSDVLLAAVGLSSVADVNAQSLPLGTRRMLELGRSLAAEPSLLLLDEVASGLDDDEIHGLSRVIRGVRQAGGSILLVEHNFALVRELADRVVVLSQGKVIVVDTPEAVAKHPAVLEHYLGEPVSS